MNMPSGLESWTADEVAECLSLRYAEDSNALYRKLYETLACATNPTPLGGDGEGGTVEEPAGRLGDYDDKAPKWWRHLSTADQRAIAKAYEEEFGS